MERMMLAKLCFRKIPPCVEQSVGSACDEAQATRSGQELSRDGYDPLHGARRLKRLIQRETQDPPAKRILSGEFAAGDRVTVDVRGEVFSFGT